MKEQKLNVKVNKKILIPFVVGFILAFAFLFLFVLKPSSEVEQATPLKVLDENNLPSLMEVKLDKLAYSNNDLKVTFTDTKLAEDLLSMELKSHSSVDEIRYVEAGNQVVMYYDIDSTYGLEDALGTPIFYDVKTGEIVEREWRYVYLFREERERDICLKWNTFVSKFIEFICLEEGKEKYIFEEWREYNSKDIISGSSIIGIIILYGKSRSPS